MADTRSFATYVAEVKTDYEYVLKFAVPEMTDGMIDMLEHCLLRYDLKKASPFRKTPIQENPLDFPNAKNVPVFICDIVLGYPASMDFLRTHICNALTMSPQLLAVYTKNDPRQIETDLYVERTSPDFKKDYETRLGSFHEPMEGEGKGYGDDYNKTFLKELEKVRKDRKIVTVTNPLIPAQKEDTSMLPKGYEDWNAEKNFNRDDEGLFGRVKRPPLIKVGKL